MGGLSRWAVRKPWWALGAFALLAVVVFTLGGKFGGDLNDSFSLPDTESKTATDLLAQMPNNDFDAATAKIVWSPEAEGASAVDQASAATIVPLLTTVSELPGVDCVTNPFDQTGAGLGSNCPQGENPFASLTPAQQAALKPAIEASVKAASPVSPNGHVAYSTITFSGSGDGSGVPPESAKTIVDEVKKANGTGGMQVGASGQILAFAGQEPPSSEGFGVTVALII